MTNKMNETQAEMSRKVLEMKKAAEVEAPYMELQEATPGDGPVSGPNEHNPVMGAFDAEGYEPVLRRSRHER